MKNVEPIDIPNVNFVVSYKRPEVSAAGVAIYNNTGDSSHTVTSYMDIHTNFTSGELCFARCNSESGQNILMVAVYISPGKSIKQIQ